MPAPDQYHLDAHAGPPAARSVHGPAISASPSDGSVGAAAALDHHAIFPPEAVDLLTASILADRRTRYLGGIPLPNRRRIIALLDDLAGLMYPGLIPPGPGGALFGGDNTAVIPAPPVRPGASEGGASDPSASMPPRLSGRRDVAAYVETLGARVAVTLFEEIRAALCYERAREGATVAVAADARSGATDAQPHRQPPHQSHQQPGVVRDCLEHLSEGMRRDCQDRAASMTRAFMERLPEVRRMLSLDVQAALDGDPAACSTDEAILTYPGVRAITVFRLAHELYRLKTPLIPRMMSEYAHSRTGIDLHPGARIGESFFIDHGTGVVIGETTDIGRHCKIYQGVTLGARSFPKDERGRLVRGVKRHPTLGNRVTVYASATILGGDTVIGDDCVINGGVFLVRSVPSGHIVRSEPPQLRLRTNPEAAGLEMDASGI